MKFCQVGILFFFFSFFCRADQFIYPVAAVKGESQFFLCVLHQVDLESLQLYFYDSESNVFQKGLSSRFFPASFKIIPGNKGFSFIDAGRIRIKEFLKKSPKAIDISAPLYNFSTMDWIDEKSFYTSAKRGNFFGIFQVGINGAVDTIVFYDGIDCMCPQKVDAILFYVKRKSGQSSIVAASYPLVGSEKKGDLSGVDAILQAEKAGQKSLISQAQEKLIFEAQPNQNIIFLHASEKNRCFFLRHRGSIGLEDQFAGFSYHQIEMTQQGWEHKKLFDFSIPKKLLSDPQHRLYESLLPFLPVHYKKKIYFSNFCADSDALNLFSFCTGTQEVQQKTAGQPGDSFFAPLPCGQTLFFGSFFQNAGHLLQGTSL